MCVRVYVCVRVCKSVSHRGDVDWSLRWLVVCVRTVVGKLLAEPQVRDGVRIHHRGTAACDHGPHPAVLVEDGELEGRAGALVELLDEDFLGEFGTTKGCGELELQGRYSGKQ